jgi:hypothetical protein
VNPFLGIALSLCVMGNDPVDQNTAVSKIEVLILPAESNHTSALVIHDFGRNWRGFVQTDHSRAMAALKDEIDTYATVRFLSPKTLGGFIERPAIRVGRGEWVTIKGLEAWEVGGSLIYVRKAIDEHVRREVDVRAESAYLERLAEHQKKCKVIYDRWCDELQRKIASGRFAYDDVGTATATYPEPPDEPVPTPEFDYEEWSKRFDTE